MVHLLVLRRVLGQVLQSALDKGRDRWRHRNVVAMRLETVLVGHIYDTDVLAVGRLVRESTGGGDGLLLADLLQGTLLLGLDAVVGLVGMVVVVHVYLKILSQNGGGLLAGVHGGHQGAGDDNELRSEPKIMQVLAARNYSNPVVHTIHNILTMVFMFELCVLSLRLNPMI